MSKKQPDTSPSSLVADLERILRHFGAQVAERKLELLTRIGALEKISTAPNHWPAKRVRNSSRLHYEFSVRGISRSPLSCMPIAIDLRPVQARPASDPGCPLFLSNELWHGRRRSPPRYRVLLPEVATLLAMADLETWSAQQRRALELYAPLLCMISDLGAWAHKEKGALLRITKSKGERSESQADLLLMQHERSCEALRRLAS